MRIFTFFLAMQLFTNCHLNDDDCHHKLTFENMSSETIWFGLGRGDEQVFPCKIGTGGLDSGSSYTQQITNSCWEKRINGGYRGSLAVYYFSEPPNSTSEDCNEEELNSIVTERREYTIEELNGINWIISYP